MASKPPPDPPPLPAQPAESIAGAPVTSTGRPLVTSAPPTEHLPFPLQDGETPVLISRRHWLYLWPSIALRLVFALVPIGALAWALSAIGGLDGTGARVFWFVAAIWALYWLVRIALTWYAYHNDLWVITNQRIVDSFRPNPFNIRLSTADLVNVQDMTVHRSGIMRTIFDYGDIVCQTAASNQDFRLVGIPEPREVQVIVDRERDRERLRYA